MGPGYFPRILGILLIVLGTIITLQGMRVPGEAIPKWHWRPTLVVLGSVVVFGLIVGEDRHRHRHGLPDRRVRRPPATSSGCKESIIAGVLLSALAVGVFVIGLGVQLPIWPTFFQQLSATMELI